MVHYLRLEPPLEEVLDLEAEHVIELHPGLVEHPDADETAEEGVALEQPAGVLLFQGEEVAGGLADLGQGELDPPDLALVPQPILADELQLLVEAGLLKGAAGGRVDLGVDRRDAAVHHSGGANSGSSREQLTKQTEQGWIQVVGELKIGQYPANL